MTKSENKNVVEVHGCIVCAKLFDILAVYTPDGGLVDCAVISPGGHIVPDIFIPQLIDLYKTGRFPIDKMVKFYKFKDINQAVEDSEKGSTVKAVVTM